MSTDSQSMDLDRKLQDDLSDLSTPRSQDSEVDRAQQASDVQDLPVSRGGDRVMSRRSGQQASTADIFGRPPSPYHSRTGRLSSASANAESVALLDPLGQSYTQDMLHHSIHGEASFLSEKQRSCLMDGVVHNLHMISSDLEDLQVNDEVRGLFDYIGAYKIKDVEIGTTLKPFIPDYILAVGAIDEFIKVPRPDNQPDYLGLKVLDESGSKQSDPAVLTLQLRAASSQPNLIQVEISSVEHADKNPRKLDAWISSIKDLHQTKPQPSVIYSKQMPDIEKLMQEWTPSIEKVLSEIELPTAKLDVDLITFIDICCAILDIPVFWVHPDWFVVHVDHPLSPAWIATLGPDPLASQRLQNVKSLYAAVKSELISRPTYTGICFSPGVCTWDVRSSRVSEGFRSLPPSLWSRGTRKILEEEKMWHWSCVDKPPDTLIRSSSSDYMEELHDLRYHYATSKLRRVSGTWPLRRKLPRRSRDISLVTVATWDRLQRLSAQCRVWKGVICAAIFAPDTISVEALEADLLRLHDEVERAGRCRLDLILLESATVERRSCCCQVPGVLPICNGRTTKTKHYCSTELCPMNALRNAALGLAVTDLVLLLDVDLLPAASLNECSEDEEQYNCLWRMAIQERC